MNELLIAIFAGGIGVLTWLGVKQRNMELERAKELQEQFYTSAKKVCQDNDTNEEVREFIVCLSEILNSRVVSWHLLWSILKHKILPKDDEDAGSRTHRLYMMLRPEIRGHFGIIIASAALRVTYNSFLAGALIRYLALKPVKTAERARDQKEYQEAEWATGDIVFWRACSCPT
mgnify:CR=1 FL=1